MYTNPNPDKPDMFDDSIDVQIEAEAKLNQMGTVFKVQDIFNYVLQNCDLIFSWSYLGYFVTVTTTTITTTRLDQNNKEQTGESLIPTATVTNTCS